MFLSQLLTIEIIWLALGALIIGAEKAGIKGLGMITVTIYALILGGKASAGLVLLLFMLADLFAIKYYFKSAQWKIIFPLLLPSLLGILAGSMLGNAIDDEAFKNGISFVILSCLILILIPQLGHYFRSHSTNSILAIAIGFLTGFSTMIANVSSPILAVYLLALQLPKLQFIGTIVWYFFIINILKLPFHIWAWETIQWQTLSYALVAIPSIGIGFLIGLFFIKRVNESSFRYLIIGVTVIAAMRLLLN